jgi:bisphosphoglycerate-independent phosphoglycerate mutase (AlkP superfamily)
VSLPAGPVFPGIACACLVVMDGWGIAPAGPDNGDLAHNQVVRHALTASERVHLVGMVSEGGVHSAFGHLRALIAPPPS